jgi:GWxTD domain-containing protein
MRKSIVIVLISVLFLPLYAEKKKTSELPENYRKWIEEEVVYIITSREKDVFLRLETDRERDIFIDAFWKQRDPTPGTPRNEFREEHYRRLGYANEYFGRGTPRPGWKTDQGMVYIILGPPNNIEKYENVMNVYPTQIWFYFGDPKLGLPTAFNVIFFKKEGIGEYILYSPTDHGPQALIADYMQTAPDPQAAYDALARLEPNLARQTLTLIPGESAYPGMVSLASSTLLSNIFSSPQKKVEDHYSEALLKYKDMVEVEYTANYIGNDSMVRLIKDESGFFLVHYSIEPKKLSVDLYGNSYSANFELNGRITDLDGRTIFQYNKEIPLKFNHDQLKDLESKSFALQDMFPLVPGHFRFDLLLKNTVSKEFTSFEVKLTVPQDISAPQMPALILGYKVEDRKSESGEIVPFRVGGRQILCQPSKIFSSKDSLFVFSQIIGLSDDVMSRGFLKFEITKEGQVVSSKKNKISYAGEDINFIEELSLKDLVPGYYTLKVSVLSEDDEEILSGNEDFEITSSASLPRPLIISRIMPASHYEEYTYNLGIQHLNLGHLEEAYSLLEESYHKRPELLEYALGLSQVLFIKQDYQRVKDILAPFLVSQGVRGQVFYFLGKSCHALGQFEEALSHYKSYLSRIGTNLEILNLMGSCYYQLGNKEEALKTWKKSLEINANQEDIKKLVQSLEGEKK